MPNKRFRPFWLAAGVVASAGATVASLWWGLGDLPSFTVGMLTLMALWWVTDAQPLWLTALVPMVLAPLAGLFGKGVYVKGFTGNLLGALVSGWDAYLLLFAASMAYAYAMKQTGLHERIALKIMDKIGATPKRLLWGIYSSACLVSWVISDTAAVAMMFPIVTAILTEVDYSTNMSIRGFKKASYLALMHAANIGGVALLIGTPPNVIAADAVRNHFGLNVGFLQYALIGIPFVILFSPVSFYLALWPLAKECQFDCSDMIRKKKSRLGPMSREAKLVAIVGGLGLLMLIASDPARSLILAFIGFKLKPSHYESGVTVVVALLALYFLRTGSPFFRSLKSINWGTLALLSGGFALAGAVEASNLGQLIKNQLSGINSLPFYGQTAVVSAGSIVATILAANTATIQLLVKILPGSTNSIAGSTLFLAAGIGVSLDFILPSGTAANAAVAKEVGGGLMAKTGLLVVLAGVIFLWLYSTFIIPLILMLLRNFGVV